MGAGSLGCSATVIAFAGAEETENLSRRGLTDDSSKPVIWVERSRRQASENVTSDHDPSWLTERLAETVPDAEFWFYFRDPSDNPLKD